MSDPDSDTVSVNSGRDNAVDLDAELSTVDPDLLADVEAQWRTIKPENRLYVEWLARESPRGMILVVGAYGEAAVESLLRAACVKTGAQLENLLGHQAAPLGSFSARIAACWCLGLLPQDDLTEGGPIVVVAESKEDGYLWTS